MKKAFTLIELLIVVAIIAILAAIAVPNFLEAQTRAKIARVLSDQRTYATALETYQIDNSTYPLQYPWFAARAGTEPPGYVTESINSALAARQATAPSPNPFTWRPSFGYKNGGAAGVAPVSLTTPVSYLNTYVPDTFQDKFKGQTFSYVTGSSGFIIWSPGPDTKDQLGDNAAGTGAGNGANAIVWSGQSLPSPYLIAGPANVTPAATGGPTTGGAFTYDATNGTSSEGDTYRTK